jgi:hypothetical protein
MGKQCKKCKVIFPFKLVVDGKRRNLKNRKFCLDCSPFGKHNTRCKPLPDVEREFVVKEKARLKTQDRRCKIKWRLVGYKGGKCIRCGYKKKVAAAFSFHHRDPSTKQFALSRAFFGKAWNELKAEVDKCDLLCVRCHAEVHEEIDKIAYRERKEKIKRIEAG